MSIVSPEFFCLKFSTFFTSHTRYRSGLHHPLRELAHALESLHSCAVVIGAAELCVPANPLKKRLVYDCRHHRHDVDPLVVLGKLEQIDELRLRTEAAKRLFLNLVDSHEVRRRRRDVHELVQNLVRLFHGLCYHAFLWFGRSPRVYLD